MISFENGFVLWFILLLPMFYWFLQKAEKYRYNRIKVWTAAKEDETARDNKDILIKIRLWLAATAFIIVAIANPRLGWKEQTALQSSFDLYIALDISKSMDATDTPPSRLEVAKKKISSLISELKGNRFGIVLFAGEAYLAMPLTTDYNAAISVIQAAGTDQAAIQGTDIEAAADIIAKTHQRVGKSGASVLLITDGEDHENGAVKSVEKLASEGLSVFTAGAGTEEGGSIMGAEGLYTDDEGNEVKTRMNSQLIESMAKAGGGQASYLYEENWENKIFSLLSQSGSKSIKQTTRSYREYTSYAFIPLLIATVFVFWLFILYTDLAKKSGKGIAFVILLVAIQHAYGQSVRKFAEGNDKFLNEQYDEARKCYEEGLEKEENNKARYNLGNTHYKTGNFDAAILNYELALKNANTPEQAYKTLHNTGNAYYRKGNWDAAIDAYKKALKIKPGAENTVQNLLLSKQQKNKKEQQSKESNDQQSGEGKERQENSSGNNREDADEHDTHKNKDKKSGNSQNSDSARNQQTNKPAPEGESGWTEEKAMLEYIEREEIKVQQQLRRQNTRSKQPKKPW